MRRLMLGAMVALVLCGVSWGQEGGPNAEHLQGFGPMLGVWRYEGPLLESIPDFAEKETKLVFQFSWRRILDRSAVEENWFLEFKGGKRLSGKALIGWHPVEEKLIYGGMDSIGGISLGTVELDAEAKTSTLTENGIDGKGEKTTFKGVVTKTGRDTLTWQALERTGGIVDGPSPVYAFKRAARTGQPRRVQPPEPSNAPPSP